MDGRCRAAVRGQDPLDPLDPRDPRMELFLRVLGIKTVKTNIRFQNYNVYCVFLLVFVMEFLFLHFHSVLPRFWMHFCSKAAQKLLRRPSEAVEVWVSEHTVQ